MLAVFIPAMVLCMSALRITLGFSGNAHLPSDCAIVFGNAVYPSGLPGPGIERRVATAVRLMREGQVRRLIVSGGLTPGYPVSEAQAMQSVAVSDGVDAQMITLESHARSTWENVLFSRPLAADCSSVIGISDRYHLARIQLLARRQGWGELATYPTDDRPPSATEWKSLLRETFAYAYYWLRIDAWYPLAPEAT